MYRFLDRQTDALDSGSALLLRSMRGWVLAVASRNCPRPRVEQLLAEAGAPPISDRLMWLMQLLHHNGVQPMKFGQMEKPRITEAEALMLALWHDVTADRAPRAIATLELLVRPEAIGAMMNMMVETVAHLSAAGLAPAPLPDHLSPSNGRTTS